MLLYWATIASFYWAHQVMEEHNSLPTTQTTNRVPQNCWNCLTITYWIVNSNGDFRERRKLYGFDSKFRIMAQYSIQNEKKTLSHSTISRSHCSVALLVIDRHAVVFTHPLCFCICCVATCIGVVRCNVGAESLASEPVPLQISVSCVVLI